MLAVAGAVLLLRTRGRRSAPGSRPLPGTLVEPYKSRLPEIERQQPQEAAASAKLLVDDMLNRMGYPVRMATEERVRDLRGRRRAIADLYKEAAGPKSEPQESLQRYLEIARRLLDEAVHHEHGEVA